MRIVSLLPSATEIVFALGLGDELVGRTHECDYPPEAAEVAGMTEAEDEAVGLVEVMRERLASIENRVLERRLQGVSPRRVVCLEWLDPPFASGHWVPEQVRRAGGWELLGAAGEPARQTTWEQV